MRKTAFAILMLLTCIGLTAAHGMSKKQPTLTMIVMPARYSVLQVGFDMARGQGAVLVSYQGVADTEEPLLHAWNGREWVYISLEDYSQANFLQLTPQRAVLVGDETELPQALIPASTWCPVVMSIPTVDTATLVNSFAKVFSFSQSEWQWFTSRYNLELVDLNQDHRSTSWYDKPHVRYRRGSSRAATALRAEKDLYNQVFDPQPIVEDASVEAVDIAQPEPRVDDTDARTRLWEPDPAEIIEADELPQPTEPTPAVVVAPSIEEPAPELSKREQEARAKVFGQAPVRTEQVVVESAEVIDDAVDETVVPFAPDPPSRASQVLSDAPAGWEERATAR